MNDDEKIRPAFHRLRRDVATTVSASDGLDRLERRDARWRRAAVPALGAAVFVLVAVGAFALLRSEQPVQVGVTTLPPVPTTAPVVPDTTPVTSPDTVPETTPGTFPDPAGLPDIGPGDVLVAGDESIYSWNGSGATLLLDAPALTVVADLFDGIVYNHSDSMWWIPEGSFESQLLVPRRVDLHTVALIEDQPTAIYTESTESDSPVTSVHLYGVFTGEDRIVYEFGPMEGGISRVSYGGGLLALTVQTDGGVFFAFTDVEGNAVDVPNPLPELSENFTWADQALLSPDGGTLLYLEGDELREAVDLVMWDMTAGAEVGRLPLGGSWQGRIGADFDGRTVVVSQQLASWTEPLRFELSGGVLTPATTVGIGGSPSIVRAPQPSGGPSTTLPPARCSADSGFADVPYGDMPAPVASTRAQLAAAAVGCDFDRLDEIAAASGQLFVTFEPWQPGLLAAAEEGGDPVTGVILRLVNQPFGITDGGEELGNIYVWPRVASYESWAEATDEDLDFLRLMGDDEQSFQFYEDFGGYAGWRLGITENGDWLFLTVGD